MPPRILPNAVKSLARVSLKTVVEKKPIEAEVAAPIIEPVAPAIAPSNKPPAPAHEQTIARRPCADIEKKQDLPVLEAFQEFLDAERKQAKRRMTILALSLITVLVAVAAVVLIIGASYVRDLTLMRQNVEQVQEQTSQMNSDTKSTLENVNSEAAKLRKEIEMEKLSLTETAEEVKLRADSQQEDVAKLMETVNAMKTENDALRTDLARLKGGWPAISTKVDTLRTEIARMRSQYFQEGEQTDGTIESSASLPACIVMQIVPRGKTEPATWRLPIPE